LRSQNCFFKRIFIRFEVHLNLRLSTENSTFITLFKLLQPQHTLQRSILLLIEATRRSNKRISTHYKTMRNLEFIKSTNTNSQTLCNSEELLDWEGCTLQPCARCYKRVDNGNARLKNFFNWKTYA